MRTRDGESISEKTNVLHGLWHAYKYKELNNTVYNLIHDINGTGNTDDCCQGKIKQK